MPVSKELNDLAERVIGAAIEVHRELGPGFAEITYQRALVIELEHLGISFTTETPIALTYRDKGIGKGRLDLLVEQQLIVELKAVSANPKAYRRQVVKYLKTTGLELGLVINFEVDKLVDGVARVIHTP